MKTIGVIAPALTFKMGVEGREAQVEETKNADDALRVLGEEIGRHEDLILALGGQMGLQEVCRAAFRETSGRETKEYSFYSSSEESQNAGMKLPSDCKVFFIGGGKESLANYEKMIHETSAVIFAGGFYRAAAAALMAVHQKGLVVGILGTAGTTPRALMDFLEATGLPDSARKRLVYEEKPRMLVSRLLSLVNA